MRIHKQKGWVLFFATLLWLLFMNGASIAAEKAEFPNKTIKIISPWPGGGGGDQEIRGFSLYLKKYIPVEIMIENVPGADTRIALTKAWKSGPDGYTLIYTTPPQPILNEHMFKTEYRTKEFVPVYGFLNRIVAMTVNVESWKDIEEFIATARTKTLSIGLSSLGSAAHLNALAAVKAWGIINVNWVPYRTGSEAVTQVAGKHIDAAFTMGTTAFPLIRAGKIRALLKFSETPMAGFENVPSPIEKGYHIPMISGLGGIVAPPKTPTHVIKILEQACDKTSRDPEFLDWAAKGQYDVLRLPSEDFKKKILEQYKIVEENMEIIKKSMSK